MKGIGVKWLLGVVLGVASVALLGGCASTAEKGAAAEEAIGAVGSGESKLGTVLLFVEQEAGGGGTFTTRMFVNPDYMHISDNRSPSDYLLFDRRARVIYSVNADDKTVFEIHAKPVTVKPPITIDYEEESQPSSAIPKVGGRQATHYRYLANGRHCYDSVVLPEDFLPDVTAAMREFRAVLAGEHASTLDRVPVDMLDACDLALNIFEPNRHMAHGMPIREWDRKGYQRFLKDYRGDVTVPVEMLTVPKDYRHYAVDDALSGGEPADGASGGD